MSWYIVTVKDPTGRDEGAAIFCSTTGAFVRPLVGHPQSVFSEEVTEKIAAYLTEQHGDPRKGEHTIDGDTLTALCAGLKS